MTYYIAVPEQEDTAIAGIGATPEQALAKPLSQMDPEERADHCLVAVQCTDALYAQVEAEGGDIAWGCLPDGRRCTLEEEEAGEE